jgi:hypothetical protein
MSNIFEAVKQLAGPLAGALHTPAQNAINQLLARPRVQQLFINASSFAHEKLVNVLENTTGHGISTGDGVVTLDLHALVTELGQELGLSDQTLAKIPADAGVITLMKSDQLTTIQKLVDWIHKLSALLLIAVFALYAIAIFLAKGHRRETLRDAGWAFAMVGLIVLLIRRVISNRAVDALSSPEYRGSIRDVWLIGTAILYDIAIAAVIYGLIAVVGAIIDGPTRLGTWVRRHAAPTLNNSPAVAFGALVGLMLLLAVWGPTHALRTWWGVLALGGLLALGLFVLRRQTLREFPAATDVEATAAEPDEAPQAPASPAEG